MKLREKIETAIAEKVAGFNLLGSAAQKEFARSLMSGDLAVAAVGGVLRRADPFAEIDRVAARYVEKMGTKKATKKVPAGTMDCREVISVFNTVPIKGRSPIEHATSLAMFAKKDLSFLEQE